MTGTSEGKILVVDEDSHNIDIMVRLMTSRGYDVISATSGDRALEAVARAQPDVVLLDVSMSGIDGVELCRRLKSSVLTRLTPVIIISGWSTAEDRLRGIDAGADDFLGKPLVAAELEARVRSLTRLKRYTDDLDSAESVILSLALTIEARDAYTGGHCQRLAACATAFGGHLGLDEDQRVALYRGGFLHDIGKVGVPDSVLLKPGALLPAEYAVMQTHTVIGDALCSRLQTLQSVRPLIRHHHERTDGTGYPDHLKSHEIPLLASVIGIVDAYDAMTTARPYRPLLTPETAVRELRSDAENGWRSRELVEAFRAFVAEDGFDALVQPTSDHARPPSALAYVVRAAGSDGVAARIATTERWAGEVGKLTARVALEYR